MHELLKGYTVETVIPVESEEIGSMGFVNNVNYFRYFQSAILAYTEKVGYIDHLEKTGEGIVVGSTDCKFKTPVAYPDMLHVGARATSVKDDSFVLEFCLVSEQKNTVAAEGSGVIVAYDRNKQQKMLIPQFLKDKILESKITAE
ncbi:MAG: acyl-CoA thioesterase [Deltaproteobacteria bacterium]|nr:MAG: acyl-CoA thioesterase [Deltaproteobacteria bacterium]